MVTFPQPTFLLLLLLVAAAASAAQQHRVMPWMCLERCHEDIPSDLKQIEALKGVLSAVSFEAYDLDFGAALRDNNFTRVGPRIASLGLRGVPMLTTANIAKLRELWQSPASLADAATAAVVAGGFSGLNVDFEPENGDPPTAADARSFAAFVDTLAKRLHAADPRLELTVDIASWSAFWDFGLLAETAVDRLLTMDTYCGNTTLFEQRLVKAVSAIGVAKLGIGLETVNPNTGKPFTLDEMQARFALIRKFGIQEIDIWEAPIPELWVPLIQDWVNSK